MGDEAPNDLLYTPEHIWLQRDGARADEAIIGVTQFAQEQLGDVVYLELPAVGTTLTAGEPFGEIESAKTVSELVAPVSGELIAVNEQLEQRPELVNESPYDQGWIARARMSDTGQLDDLLAADGYRRLLPQD